MSKIKMLIVIADRSKTDEISSTLEKHNVNLGNICYGNGTASNELIGILGIAETEKGVIIASVNESDVNNVFSILTNEYKFNQPGKGIAFTIPVSSVGGPATLKILEG